MATSTTTLEILVVTEEPTDPAIAERLLGFDGGAANVTLSSPADLSGSPPAESVDCVLCSAESSGEQCLDLLAALRAESDVPVLVFAGDRPSSFVADVLEAGAADVVRSTLADTPPELVRRRVEGLLDDDSCREVRDRELQDRDEILRHISENVSDVVWITSPGESGMEFVSDAYADIYGREPAGLYEDSQRFLECIHPADRDRVREALATQQDDPDAYDEVYRVVHPDGEVRWVHDRSFGVYEDGSLTRIIGVAQDITERKQREEERKLYEGIIETTRDTAAVYDEDGRFVVVNSRLAELYDATPADLRGERSHMLDALGERTEGTDPFEELVDGRREEYRTELEFEYPTEASRVTDVRLARLTDDDGTFVGIVAVGRDVSDRRERERKLQAERDLVERILDTSPVGIAVIDNEGTIVRASDRTADVLGLTDGDLVGRTLDETNWAVHDADGEPVPASEFPLNRVLETGEAVYGRELVVERPDDEVVWLSTSGAPMFDEDGEVTQVVMTFEDITDRKHREQQLAHQRDELAQLDRLNAVIRDVDQALVAATTRDEIETAVCERLADAGRYRFALALRDDGDGRLVPTAWTAVGQSYVDDVFPLESSSPADSPALRAMETGETQLIDDVGSDQPVPPWRDRATAAGVGSMVSVPVTHGGRTYCAISVYAEEPDAFSERELAVLDELGETVGDAIAAAERREREETLTALHEATRALLGTKTETAVCDVVVDVATDVLDISEVGIFLFDDEENVLQPVSATDRFLSFYGGVDTFGPGAEDSETWHAYMTGEQKVIDDISEAERVANPDTDARGTLIYPLGEHGTLVAASTEIGVFDDHQQRLVGLLAATAEAALDRVAGRADVREHERELADRTERLERLARVTDLVRDITEAVVDATAREAIEAAVCDRLTDEPGVAFAWIGSVPPDGDAVTPRTWAGADEGYLDEVALSLAGGDPAARTAATGTVTVVGNVTEHFREDDWARAAADRGYQSAVAVPLAYGETTYGILTVYASETDAFAGMEGDVLAELGELVGYAINAAETKQSILAERVTELELRIPGSGTVVNAIADLTGRPVEYLEIAPESGDTTSVLFAIDDAPIEDILALESEFVSVTALKHVDGDGRDLFRATVTGPTVAATLLDCGGIPAEITAHPTETVAVVRLPVQLDVRVFVDRVTETYPDTELISRRERTGREDGRRGVQGALETELTDRQREVLATAYESGFFESPRETTGAELADLLDISQPTVTHHLREGQRRLFAILFGDEDT